MRVRVPAKLNLDLRVGPARADGFHPIRSWFVTVGLYDHLTFVPADAVSLTCDDPAVPTDDRNLAWRAAAAIRPPGRGVAIGIEKQIPAGAGLGGGSSDAAYTLLAMNVFWNLSLPRDTLAAVAATLGSDVPFFLHAPSAVCEGRGEIVTPRPPPACGWAVLILPPVAMPTPAVFCRFDQRGGATPLPAAVAPPKTPWWRRKPAPPPTDAISLLSGLLNDLEPAAFDLRPELGDLRVRVERLLGRPVRMSGSGSTLFTLYDAARPAIAAATAAESATGVRCLAVPIGVYPRGIPPDDPPGEGNETPRA